MSELRRDPILSRWVVVTGQPWEDLVRVLQRGRGETADGCPFCPGHEAETPPEVFAVRSPGPGGTQAPWAVRVVPNKFPFLRIEGDLARVGEGIYDKMSGTGAHEIVIESPAHEADWHVLGSPHVAEILRAYRERSRDLRGDRRFRCLLTARNYGRGLAALPHPHSHILALPVIPKRLEEELRGTLEYDHRKERCVYCDMIREELRDGRRLIAEGDGFVALVPFAARYPLEVCLLPRSHAHDFGATEDAALRPLADLLCTLVGRLHTLLSDPAYSLVLHSSPLGDFVEPRYHWHVEVRVRLPLAEGFEWGTGFFVNPLPPEEAARLLRGGIAN